MSKLIPSLSILMTAALAAQMPPQPAPTALQRRSAVARARAEELRERLHLPGLSVAVAREGKLVFAEGFGMADLEQSIPVTRLTKFRIGSISKLITIAAAARLADLGKLDFGDRVRPYVPHFPEKKFPILVRQLCAHTSGVRH